MKTARVEGGYTVIETLIFLAISTALFVVAYNNAFSNRGKTEFSQGVRELDSQLLDFANDVENGYYPSVGNQTCVLGGAGGNTVVSVTPGGAEFGASGSCVFAGRIVKSPVPGTISSSALVTPRQYQPLVGQKRDVESVTEVGGYLFAETNINIPYSLTITKVARGTGAGVTINGFGFVSTFTNRNTASGTNGTFTKTQLVVFDTPPSNPLLITTANITNAASGVYICVKSESSNQKALLRIGGSNQQLTTAVYFDQSVAAVFGGCP